MSRFYSMLWLWTVAVLGLIGIGVGNEANNQARIINGKKAWPGKWPFMAAILVKGNSKISCGGSVLNHDTILTAAHCLDGKTPEQLKVFVGIENIRNVGHQFEYQPRQLIMHENYSYKPFNNDIGVIKLQNPIELTELSSMVKPSCFTDNQSDVDQLNCYVIGWGRNENGTSSDDLYELREPILDDNLCAPYANVMIRFNSTTMLCAGYVGQGKSHCKGDSGGPLVCPFKTNPEQFSQLGIVSSSKGCRSNPNVPGFYTRVIHYLDWIEKQALE